jgi:hypothetical protein
VDLKECRFSSSVPTDKRNLLVPIQAERHIFQHDFGGKKFGDI